MSENNKLLIVLIVILKVVNNCQTLEITGFGWHSPQLVFNSRYFFVWDQLVHNVVITSPDSGCRVWTQVFNQTDFGFNTLTIIRYKLLSDVCLGGLEISLFGDKDKNELLARKVVVEDVWNEGCVCRRHDWSEAMKCQQMTQQFKQIDSDLSAFNTSDGIVFDAVLEEMKTRFAPHKRSYSFCHYQIIDNQAYKQCYGEYVGFSQFMDEILKSLLSKTSIPDLEFISNLGDWPLSDKRTKPALPVISWCGSDDSNDIVIPTYELTESSLQMQGRISLDILSVFGKQSIKFEDKKDMLFWRGRDSNEFRLKLVELSKNNSELINASLTNFFFFKDRMEELGPKSPYVSFFDFFQYKYQMNIDGTVAAYRLPYLLAGNSLVFKQNSKYYEFFYNSMKANIHYIAIDRELNDLIEVINTFRDNNENISQIILNSRKLVLDQLLPEHIYCYYFNLFNQYSKLLKTKVQLRPEMSPVFDEQNVCNCRPKTNIRHEL